MSYSINVGFFTGKHHNMPLEDALALIAKIGFDAVDYTGDLRNPDAIKTAAAERELIERNGLFITQTHAPFNRYNKYMEEYFPALERAYERTKILGAKYLVVHGDEYPFDKYEFSYERALAYNYEIFAPYVERAERDGIALAFETVFPDLAPEKVRFCSRAEDLKELIEKFNSPAAVCCWDFGHANIAFGAEQADKIRLLGKHIKCTHVHDNRLGKDIHHALFTGDSDLVGIRRAFRDIGYDGIFSLELGGAQKMNFVPEVREIYAKYALDSLKVFDALQ